MTAEADQDDELPELTTHDLQTQLWAKLRRHMQARLQSLRTKNESDLDPTATAKVRGELKAYRDLLALEHLDPENVADDVDDE